LSMHGVLWECSVSLAILVSPVSLVGPVCLESPVSLVSPASLMVLYKEPGSCRSTFSHAYHLP